MKDIFKKLILLLLPLILFSCHAPPLQDSKTLEEFLIEENFNYEIDDEGDFRLLAGSDQPLRDVWIRGQLNYSGSVAVREIFSVSILVNEEELEPLSRVLLLDNMQTRIMGSWSILLENNPHNDVNKYLVLYTIKAGLDSDTRYILQAVSEAAQAASALENVLAP